MDGQVSYEQIENFRQTMDSIINAYPVHLQAHVMQAYVLSVISLDLKNILSRLDEINVNIEHISNNTKTIDC